MKYLNYSAEALKEKGGLQTAKEISNQPKVWVETAGQFFKESKQIHSFLLKALKESDNIMLTGAGTSSFIGYSLSGLLFSRFKKTIRPVPTTHIVSFPKFYFHESSVPLIISFARSGQSPESLATLELADKYSKKCFHLIITCNGDGALAHFRSVNPGFVFVLPDSANDKSLAMTSSYTSMLLVGQLLNFLEEKELAFEQLEVSTMHAENILSHKLDIIQKIIRKDFTRAIFLSSGSLYGTALEASLKLQELTNGHIICKGDTFLGFRHGPKVVINEDTLVAYLFSNNKYASKYEMDLVRSMNHGNKALLHLGISERPIEENNIDELINIADGKNQSHEYFQPLCYILPFQIIGFFKSLQLGLKPDNPSENGAISRVVKGVNIYPIEA